MKEETKGIISEIKRLEEAIRNKQEAINKIYKGRVTEERLEKMLGFVNLIKEQINNPNINLKSDTKKYYISALNACAKRIKSDFGNTQSQHQHNPQSAFGEQETVESLTDTFQTLLQTLNQDCTLNLNVSMRKADVHVVYGRVATILENPDFDSASNMLSQVIDCNSTLKRYGNLVRETEGLNNRLNQLKDALDVVEGFRQVKTSSFELPPKEVHGR